MGCIHRHLHLYLGEETCTVANTWVHILCNAVYLQFYVGAYFCKFEIQHMFLGSKCEIPLCAHGLLPLMQLDKDTVIRLVLSLSGSALKLAKENELGCSATATH